jgi:hypothetical protein
MFMRLQFCLFLVLVGLAVTSTDIATAQTGKKAGQKAAHKAEHAAIIAELHHAKRLLDIALHDYHGHRARADHEVHKAIHLLEHGHHHKGEYKHSFKATPHTGFITDAIQQESDNKLRQAQNLVNAAHLQLHNLHTKHGHAHHKDAAHFLTLASREIELALLVVQNYNHHHKNAQAAVK